MPKTKNSQDPGSYRDPAGQVHHYQGRILRTITQRAAADYEAVRDNPAYKDMCGSGAIVASHELDAAARSQLPDHFAPYSYILEHQKIPHISYPYEWCFSQLKAAALHHLKLQIRAFASGLVFSDASAYNIQFIGTKPIFIDVLSLRPYRKGEYWGGYTQFCRQFLYPLLLQAKSGLAFNCLYRGSMEGITATELSTILPWHKKLSLNMVLHVSSVAAIESNQKNISTAKKLHLKTLKPEAYLGILTSLRNAIAKLEAKTKRSTWDDYEQTQTYDERELADKCSFVESFVTAVKPGVLYDLGCNTGSYCMLAASAGAGHVIGYDYDPVSVDIAYHRLQGSDSILPLVMDATNPSPAMGWRQSERPGFNERIAADAFIALAFVHHLCIGRNIPIDGVVDWLATTAACGVVEFVPKEDPMVQVMLATREDIFGGYSKAHFEQSLHRRFTIRESSVVSKSGRTLYQLGSIDSR